MVASHERRLNHALNYLDTLDQDIKDWIKKQGTTPFLVKRHAQTNYYRVWFVGAPDPPEAWDLLISDCLHNMRSALDNLAYELALRFTPNLSDRQAADSEFPIFGPEPLSQAKRRKKIGCMHPRAQAVIARLQPHRRGDAYASDSLWQLHELSRVDKHRLLHTTVAGHAGTGIGGTVAIASMRMFGGSTKPCTLVMDFTTPPGRQMNMKLSLTLGVQLGEGIAKGKDPVRSLRDVYGYITGTVIPLLDPYL
jgi:hypothetical protein